MIISARSMEGIVYHTAHCPSIIRSTRALPHLQIKEGPLITADRLMTRRMANIEAGTPTIEATKIMENHKIGSAFVKQKDQIIKIVDSDRWV